MLKSTFTGRKRHRISKNWLGDITLILQIELKGFVPEYAPRSIEGEVSTWWVDANYEDSLMVASPANEAVNMPYFIGQRVLIYGNVIGTVTAPERKDMPNTSTDLWVMNPERGYALRYSVSNISSLPNGQL
jgi:hypothetical protein